jgi:ABC-type proline/glycine betaine transport system permease subunit
VSEIAIFAGLVGVVVWLFRGGTTTLIVSVIVCALGVLELTAREHFSGYRSHATLLAAIPSVAVVAVAGALIGHSRSRPLLLLAVLPVFGLLFSLLRKRFQIARQARIARPPTG